MKNEPKLSEKIQHINCDPEALKDPEFVGAINKMAELAYNMPGAQPVTEPVKGNEAPNFKFLSELTTRTYLSDNDREQIKVLAEKIEWALSSPVLQPGQEKGEEVLIKLCELHESLAVLPLSEDKYFPLSDKIRDLKELVKAITKDKEI